MNDTTPAREALQQFASFREVAEILDVTHSAVTNAASRDLLPASWFDALDRHARAEGFSVSRDAFNWRTPSKADAA
jgi:hypothetical protein